MSQLTGKGLSYGEILKLLFYLGMSVVSMVLPLTILLSSIMTFGDFGERYELAAMKAAGISLLRVMMPLMITVGFLAGILFLFSNNIIPDFQRKAKNMLFNIVSSKPAINFTPGVFIDQISGYSVKFDKIYGENGEKLEGVFLHKNASPYDDQQTIIAKKGKFAPAVDRNYLKLILYDGYVYEDKISGKPFEERKKQPNQSVKFDSLVYHFDISELIEKGIEQEKITDDYRFQTYMEVNTTLEKNRKTNVTSVGAMVSPVITQTNNYVQYIDKIKTTEKNIKEPYKIDTLKKDKKLEVLWGAYNKIEALKDSAASNENSIKDTIKQHNKIVMYQQRIISYSFTCLIFFLIGASLGSIIRKGGMGLPVIIAIVIFIIFYVLNLTVENMSWKGKINPYIAAWIPNMVLFPFSVWITYKALTDSQLFDIEKYKALFKPLIEKFSKPKEHQRYQ